MGVKEQGPGLVPFGGPPPYAACGPSAAVRAVTAAAAGAREAAAGISAQSGPADWDGVAGALDEAFERMEREYGLVAHMHAVAASPEWDEANRKCLAELVGASTEIMQDRGLYERMLALRDAGVAESRRRILDDTIAGFELSGVGLGGDARKRFAENEQRLSQLGSEFEEHVRKATSSWGETVTDEGTLAAMPEDMREAAKDGGGWRFTLLDPSYAAYMAHGADRGLRERMCEARNARASDLGDRALDNMPLVSEIRDLRFEQADALGYPDPATMILSRRMAKEPGEVASFLSRIAGSARGAAERELRELSSFAAGRLGIDRLEPWDMSFAVERYREDTLGISDAEVRPYFGANKVMEGMFGCVGRLFGVSTRESSEVAPWASGVSCLEVAGGSGERVGTLCLDLYARKEKRGGAWAHGALARCRFGERAQLPTALMNCNFTAGKGGGDPRLGWQEVVTLFHEAGHAFHHLLGRVDDFCASGMNGVEWDAVELPSQFMENFAWRREVARGMSAHAETGEPIPDELYGRLVAQRKFLPGLFLCRQASFATYDLRLHSERGADPLKLWEEVRDSVTVVPHLSQDRFPCSFGHIFAGGYATGYYGYLWAEVLAADAYEMFEDPGADDGELGRRFCSEVLERGGTRDAGDNFRALRGRDPDPAALLRRYGLA